MSVCNAHSMSVVCCPGATFTMWKHGRRVSKTGLKNTAEWHGLLHAGNRIEERTVEDEGWTVPSPFCSLTEHWVLAKKVWIPFPLSKKLGWNAVGESAIIVKWLGVSAEFILVSKADLGLLFILSKTDSWLKKFGRWGIIQPKAHLSGNVQRSSGGNFWVGNTWTWH